MPEDWAIEFEGFEFAPIPQSWLAHLHAEDRESHDGPRLFAVSAATYDGLELRLDEPVSRRKLQQILRAGLTATECSPLRDQVFTSATIDWRDLDGNSHGNWQVVVDGKLLGPAGSG